MRLREFRQGISDMHGFFFNRGIFGPCGRFLILNGCFLRSICLLRGLVQIRLSSDLRDADR